MGRHSIIDKLPEEVREALHEWLRDPSISQAEAAERVNELLDELKQRTRVSRAAVARYDVRMRKVGDKLRQSRQVADAWIAKLGSAPGGKLGHLVTEMLRTLAFDLSLRLQESDLDDESLPGVVDAAAKISLMAQRLERASEINVRREREIKRQAAEELAEKAAADTKRGGAITPERLQQIIRESYGV